MAQQAAPAEAEVPRVNERLQQIEDAVAKARSEEWSPEELGHFLEGIAQVLAEKERHIREIEIPEEAADDFREELEVGYAGIDLYNQGIATLLGYIQELDPVYLDEGLELVRQGNEYVNEAMRINRENRRKLEEMYSDSSTMM